MQSSLIPIEEKVLSQSSFTSIFPGYNNGLLIILYFNSLAIPFNLSLKFFICSKVPTLKFNSIPLLFIIETSKTFPEQLQSI